jgi:adenylate cyclase
VESRLAGVDKDRTLARLRGLPSDSSTPASPPVTGCVVKRTGDGLIIEFRGMVDSVRRLNDCHDDFRIGIHLRDVVEKSDLDLTGDGVNIAARKASARRAGFGSPPRWARPSAPGLSNCQRDECGVR